MLSPAGLDGERYEAVVRRNSRLLATGTPVAAGQNGMRHCTPILRWSSSGKLHPHRLAEDTANRVGIAVLFDMPEFSLAADDGIEVTVAEFGLNRGLARLAGHGSLHLDRPAAVIAPVSSRAEA